MYTLQMTALPVTMSASSGSYITVKLMSGSYSVPNVAADVFVKNPPAGTSFVPQSGSTGPSGSGFVSLFKIPVTGSRIVYGRGVYNGTTYHGNVTVFVTN